MAEAPDSQTETQPEQQTGQDQDQELELFRTRELLRGEEISYASAKEKDSNLLHRLSYCDKRNEFFGKIYANYDNIKKVIARHLGLRSSDAVHLAHHTEWLYGSFNVCIRVQVEPQKEDSSLQLIMRFALPFKIGDLPFPGNADEKVRTEAGTYAWLQENCPTIRIPHLYGFGLSNGRRVSKTNSLSRGQKLNCWTVYEPRELATRSFQRLRRWVMQLLGYGRPTRFTLERAKHSPISDMPYLLIEYIQPEEGQMLADTWEEGRHNPELRANFYSSLSRIMVTLARVPLPKVGSFVIDEDGFLRLQNRPLTKEIHQLENENIPLAIPRDVTYTDTCSYVNALLSYHDKKLRHQPNAISNFGDGLTQTCALTAMRSIWTSFFQCHYPRQCFLTLTDLLQPNILVDENWNITCLIDLEWACSLPAEMIHTPWWLAGGTFGVFDVDEYAALHGEFCDAMTKVEVEVEVEEKEKGREEPVGTDAIKLSSIMRDTWARGTFWYCLAMNSPSGMCDIFYDRIQGFFGEKKEEEFLKAFFRYYTFDAYDFIEKRVEDKEKYDVALRQEFLAQ